MVWDNQLFAQTGDLFHNQSELVYSDPTYFRQVNQSLRISTLAAIDTSLAGHPTAEYLGPHNANDIDTKFIFYWCTCYVLPAYVSLFLAGPVSPRAAWETCRGQIVTDKREQDCGALNYFLLAAMTGTNASATPTLAIAAPNPPLSDQELITHCQRILETDFPLLGTAQANTQQNQIAKQLEVLIQDQCNEALLAEQCQLAAKVKPLSYLIGTSILFYKRLEAEAYEASAIWNALMNGTAGATTSDLMPLLCAKIKTTMNDMHVRYMLCHLEVFTKVLFGENHAVSVTIKAFLTRYMSMENTLARVPMQHPVHLRYTIYCCKNGLILNTWFRKRRGTAGPLAVPDLTQLFEDVKLDNNWEQPVPHSILNQIRLNTSQRLPAPRDLLPVPQQV